MPSSASSEASAWAPSSFSPSGARGLLVGAVDPHLRARLGAGPFGEPGVIRVRRWMPSLTCTGLPPVTCCPGQVTTVPQKVRAVIERITDAPAPAVCSVLSEVSEVPTCLRIFFSCKLSAWESE
jgi:hypothetical protein